MWKNNFSEKELKEIKHFYLPAGLNYEKMDFLDKFLMKIVSFLLSNKRNKSPEELDMKNSIKNSYDISNKSKIKPLVDYIKSL